MFYPFIWPLASFGAELYTSLLIVVFIKYNNTVTASPPIPLDAVLSHRYRPPNSLVDERAPLPQL